MSYKSMKFLASDDLIWGKRRQWWFQVHNTRSPGTIHSSEPKRGVSKDFTILKCVCIGVFQVEVDFYSLYRELTAMDLALKDDDVELMLILLPTYLGEVGPLAHLALKHRAEKCFQWILDNDHQSLRAEDEINKDLLMAAATSSASLLRKVIEAGYEDTSRTTRLKLQSTMHLCTSLDDFRWSGMATAMPKEVYEKMKLLVSLGAQATVYDSKNRTPLQEIATQVEKRILTRDFKENRIDIYNDLVQSTHLLLETMKQETCGFTVQQNTFFILLDAIESVCYSIKNGQQYEAPESRELTMHLVQKLGRLLLEYGADVQSENDTLTTYVGIAIPPTTLLKRLCEFAFFSAKERAYRYYPEMESVLKHVNLLIRMFFAQGADPSKDLQCIDWIITDGKYAAAMDTLAIWMSLMSHSNYYWYRKHILYQDFINQRRIAQSNANYRWGENRKYAAQLMRNTCPVRSLPELCRKTLYDYAPKRNMVSFAPRLTACKAIQTYLTLHIDDEEQYKYPPK